MTACCKPTGPHRVPPRRHTCPVNGKRYATVGRKTIWHHLVEPWTRPLKDQRYFFCTDSDCEVVYFGQDDSIITRDELRQAVGVKEDSPERMVCYCFGITYAAASSDGRAEQFVKEKTRQSLCACETRNPSGRCCLGSFPRRVTS